LRLVYSSGQDASRARAEQQALEASARMRAELEALSARIQAQKQLALEQAPRSGLVLVPSESEAPEDEPAS
jgi:hypothetical protein